MRVYFSWAASHNPCLSFGKAGVAINRELGQICDLVPPEEAAEADLQIFLGIPLYNQRSQWKHQARRFVWFTMWETPQVPTTHIERINDSQGLISPCRWVDAQYSKRGATVPRFVVPLGIDPEVYRPIERPRRDTFTFLWLGMIAGHPQQLADRRQKTIGDRKRGWLVREAFRRLNLGKDARLILKGIPWPHGPMNLTYRTPSGSSITEVSKWMPEEELRDLYAEADIFTWPSSGEGFGLPPLEAAATGLPCIIPDYSGLSAYFDPAWCLGLPYTVGRLWPTQTYHGARVTVEDLMTQMRWAYEHQDTVWAMGQKAANVAHTVWPWAHTVKPGLARVLAYYN